MHPLTAQHLHSAILSLNTPPVPPSAAPHLLATSPSTSSAQTPAAKKTRTSVELNQDSAMASSPTTPSLPTSSVPLPLFATPSSSCPLPSSYIAHPVPAAPATSLGPDHASPDALPRRDVSSTPDHVHNGALKSGCKPKSNPASDDSQDDNGYLRYDQQRGMSSSPRQSPNKRSTAPHRLRGKAE